MAGTLRAEPVAAAPYEAAAKLPAPRPKTPSKSRKCGGPNGANRDLARPARRYSSSSLSTSWRNLPKAQLLPERESSLSRPAQIIPSVLRSTRKPE